MPLIPAGSMVTAEDLALDYTAADTVGHSVTAASWADLSSVYTIPAGDAQANTAYRLTSGGFGTWGSTAQQLDFRGNIGGQFVGASGTSIASTTFSTSAVFRWKATLLIIVTTVGASGSFAGVLDGAIAETANNLNPGTAGNNSLPFVAATNASPINTTTATSFSIQIQWGSTSGGPTITTDLTLYEKLGG